MFVWYSHSIRVQTSSPHLGGWCIVGNPPQVLKSPSLKSQHPPSLHPVRPTSPSVPSVSIIPSPANTNFLPPSHPYHQLLLLHHNLYNAQPCRVTLDKLPAPNAPPSLHLPSPRAGWLDALPYAQPNMPWAASLAAAGAGISSAGMRPASRSKLSWVDMNRAG